MELDFGAKEEFGAVARVRAMMAFARDGVYGLLYLISKDAESTLLIVTTTAVVNSLQLLQMAFSNRNRVALHWIIKEYFQPFLRVFALAFMEDMGDVVVLSSFVFFFSLLFVTSATSIMVQSEFASGGVKNLWVLPILRFLLRLLTTVFYVPVITVLLQSLDCGNIFDEIIVCRSTAHKVFSATVLILLVWFVLFSGLIVLVFGQRDPSVQDPEAGPHKRVEFVNSMVRALLEFMFSFLSAADNAVKNEHEFLLIALVTVSGLWLTGSYVFYLPYYSTYTNKLMVASHSIYLWSAVALILARVVNDPNDFTSLLVFVLGGPGFVFFCTSLVEVRKRQLMAETEPMWSPYLEELRLRLQFPMDANLDSQANENIMNLYLSSAKHFRESGFFNLHVSLLTERIWSHEVLSRKFLKLTQSLSLSFDNKFIVYQKMLQCREQETGAKGAISYLAFDHHVKQAQNAMSETVDVIVEFWDMLSTKGFSVRDLHELSVQVHRNSSRCKYHMRSLVSVSPNSHTVLLLFALYHEYVLNDRSMTEKLETERQKKVKGSPTGSRPLSLIDQLLQTEMGQTAECSVLAEGPELGKVLHASSGLCDLLGYPTAADLVNKSVSKIFLGKMGEELSLFLKEHVDKITTFAPTNRKLVCLHRDGHCILVDCELAPSINDQGMVQIEMVLVDVQLEMEAAGQNIVDTNMFLVIEDDCRIISGSKAMWKKIDHALEDLPQASVHVKKIVPWLTDRSKISVAEEHAKISRVAKFGNVSYSVGIQTLECKSTAVPPSFGTVLHVVTFETFHKLQDVKKESSAWQAIRREVASGKLLSENLADGDASQDDDVDRVDDESSMYDEEDGYFDEKTSDDFIEVDESIFSDMEHGLAKRVRAHIERRVETTGPMVKLFISNSRKFTLFSMLMCFAFVMVQIMLFQRFFNSAFMTRESQDRSAFLLDTMIKQEELLWTANKLANDDFEAFQGFRGATFGEDVFSPEPGFNSSLNVYGLEDEVLATGLLETLKQDIKASSRSIKQTHRELMRDVLSRSGFGLLQDTVRDPSLLLTKNGLNGTRSSLWVGALAIANRALAFSVNEYPSCLDSCKFIRQTGATQVLLQSVEEGDVRHEYQAQYLDDIASFYMASFAFSVVFYLFLCAVMYLPVLHETYRGRFLTVNAFASVPKSTVKQMHKLYSKRAKELAVLASNKDKDMDEFAESLRTKENGPERGARETPAPTLQEMAQAETTGARLSQNFLGFVNVSKKGLLDVLETVKDSTLVRIFSQLSLGARISFPAVTMVLFAAFFVVYRGHQNEVLFAQGNAVIFGQRFVATMHLVYWMKRPFWDRANTSIVHLEELAQNTVALGQLVSELDTISESIKYGDSSKWVKQVSNEDQELFQLHYSDACWVEFPGNTSCMPLSSFEDGALNFDRVVDVGNGLDLAFGNLMRLATELFENQTALLDHGIVGDHEQGTLRGIRATKEATVYPIYPTTRLRTVLEAASDLTVNNLEKQISTNVSFRSIASVVFVLFLILAHFSVVRIVKSVDSDTKKNLIVLMMLPEQVFRQRPAILELLELDQNQ
ncbi:Tiny macrocysts protein B (Gamete enriched gene 04 protein) (cAMP pathway regulator tmcB) [Durusdinium trenchii]|uniref:Tiny macrocysts protein B (Gamete enriched gene 04 protein) (cAMP pathway regulator tmcB) n=1 Tax=Durusdinium trenchii TaxID=1381693 RepID=A0ABP0RK88_9DINO